MGFADEQPQQTQQQGLVNPYAQPSAPPEPSAPPQPSAPPLPPPSGGGAPAVPEYPEKGAAPLPELPYKHQDQERLQHGGMPAAGVPVAGMPVAPPQGQGMQPYYPQQQPPPPGQPYYGAGPGAAPYCPQQAPEYPPIAGVAVLPPPAHLPPPTGGAVQVGRRPDPGFPSSQRRRLPACASCRENNGVSNPQPGVMFSCWNCRAVTQLPPGWSPPQKDPFCTVL